MVADVEINLPEGYHFNPRDYEFINYLRRRKNGQPQPCNHQFVEMDLYGKVNHPSELFQGTLEKELYFFTTLKKHKPSHERVMRKAGVGTWKTQHSTRVYDPSDTRRRVGEHSALRFETRKASSPGSRYIMHEYSLPKSENYLDVACVIKKEAPLKNSSDEEDRSERDILQAAASPSIEYQEVELGKKRTWDGECGEEDCSEPHNKSMRLQGDSHEARFPVYSSDLEPFASSQFGNNPSLVCDSLSSELPVVEDSDVGFAQRIENELMVAEEYGVSNNVDPASKEGVFGNNESERLSLDLADYDVEELIPVAINLPQYEANWQHQGNDDAFAKWMENQSVAPDDHTEANVDPTSALRVFGNYQSGRSSSVVEDALEDYNNAVNLEEVNPVATDLPHYEANWQLEGYDEAFAQWTDNQIMAPDEQTKGNLEQRCGEASAAPEWQEILMQTTSDLIPYWVRRQLGVSKFSHI